MLILDPILIYLILEGVHIIAVGLELEALLNAFAVCIAQIPLLPIGPELINVYLLAALTNLLP